MTRVRVPRYNVMPDEDGNYYVYEFDVEEEEYIRMDDEVFDDEASAKERADVLNRESISEGQEPLIMDLEIDK